MENDRIYIYSVNAKKEHIYDVDTSLFFKLGEISNEKLCESTITELLAKISFGPFYLKPNLIVLYNDICNCDLKFIYRCALSGFNYNHIDFVPLSKLVKKIKNDQNIVVFDKNYYTLIDRGEKIMQASTFDFEPVVVGEPKSVHMHFSGDDLIWKTFKSYFTNRRRYDMIDAGDDE